MKIQWRKLIACIILPLVVGGLSALLTHSGMETFQSLTKPPLAPPAWLFPVVWTILYVLMGVASYLIAVAEKPHGLALMTYALQLVFNFFWSIIFFNFEAYLFSFIWLILLWILIFVTMTQFFKINCITGCLLLPCLLWVTFAGYLDFFIYLLN